MNDAENLAKLLGHLKPELFRTFMADEFGVAMPASEKKQTKTEQREAMAAVLSALSVSERQKIEEVAEKIILLTDGAGQDVVDGFRADIFDDEDRATFDALRDQYERALWLYGNAEVIFKEALDAPAGRYIPAKRFVLFGLRRPDEPHHGRRREGEGVFPRERRPAAGLRQGRCRRSDLQTPAPEHADR
jgi:hypothetical protein